MDREYADMVTVSIIAVEYPDRDHGDEEWILSAGGGITWPRDWLVGEVESIIFKVTDDESTPPHVLNFRSTQFEWGASSASYEILLYLSQWALTSAAWDATKAVARKMNERLRADGHGGELVQPLTEQEVEERARWLIHERYQEDPSTLRLTAVELRLPDAATAEMKGTSGWIYEVDFNLEYELVSVSRIKRRRAD